MDKVICRGRLAPEKKTFARLLWRFLRDGWQLDDAWAGESGWFKVNCFAQDVTQPLGVTDNEPMELGEDT